MPAGTALGDPAGPDRSSGDAHRLLTAGATRGVDRPLSPRLVVRWMPERLCGLSQHSCQARGVRVGRRGRERQLDLESGFWRAWSWGAPRKADHSGLCVPWSFMIAAHVRLGMVTPWSCHVDRRTARSAGAPRTHCARSAAVRAAEDHVVVLPHRTGGDVLLELRGALRRSSVPASPRTYAHRVRSSSEGSAATGSRIESYPWPERLWRHSAGQHDLRPSTPDPPIERPRAKTLGDLQTPGTRVVPNGFRPPARQSQGLVRQDEHSIGDDQVRMGDD
jgi:hypothetical protein